MGVNNSDRPSSKEVKSVPARATAKEDKLASNRPEDWTVNFDSRCSVPSLNDALPSGRKHAYGGAQTIVDDA